MKRKLAFIFLVSILLCGCSNKTENQIEELMQIDSIESNYISNIQSNLNKSGVVQEKTILPQYQKLYEVNSDMVGFIYLDDNHQYPILMRKDAQNYYLNHNFFGEEEKAGSIFANVNSSFNNQGISLIYGHNMKSGDMFGTLDEFEVDDTIQIDSLYEKSTYKVVGIIKTSMHEEFSYYDYVGDLSEEDFNTWKKGCQRYLTQGSISDLTYEDIIIELSTCAYHVKDGRLVLILTKEQ